MVDDESITRSGEGYVTQRTCDVYLRKSPGLEPELITSTNVRRICLFATAGPLSMMVREPVVWLLHVEQSRMDDE